MKKLLFIGEERSDRAIKMGVHWGDGKLCAKNLFEALRNCGIDPKDCIFYNCFDGKHEKKIFLSYGSYQFIAMGNKVAKWLNSHGMSNFIKITHPAARGTIRKKENYSNHIKEQLSKIQQ